MASACGAISLIFDDAIIGHKQDNWDLWQNKINYWEWEKDTFSPITNSFLKM